MATAGKYSFCGCNPPQKVVYNNNIKLEQGVHARAEEGGVE